MSEQKPKKPRQKSKRLNLNSKTQWESILRSVEKKEIPIAFLESVSVNLTDGTVVNINVKELLEYFEAHLIHLADDYHDFQA